MLGKKRVELPHAVACHRRYFHRRDAAIRVVEEEVDRALSTTMVVGFSAYAVA